MKNSMKITFGILGLALVGLMGFWLSDQQTPEQDIQNTTKIEAVANIQQLPLDQICMVNDAFMGKKQIEVPFDGKMYYGCCDMCVEKIQTIKSARFAIDPQTGEEVDKAVAYITLDPAGTNNAVLYFESEETSSQYFGK